MSDLEVKVLRIDCEPGGRRAVYPALLCGGRERVLVDCGYPGFLPLLERAAARAGAPLSEVTGVVITHHDYDHYGALGEIKAKYPRVVTMSSAFDAPYIEGRLPPFRVSLAVKNPAPMTDEERAEARLIRERLESVTPVKIERTLSGGEVTSWCGGTEVLSTPGHMPGHISLYVRPLKTLITGDALIIAHGKLRMPNPQYAADPDEARRTAASLLAMDAVKFICYHGGVAVRKRNSLEFEE